MDDKTVRRSITSSQKPGTLFLFVDNRVGTAMHQPPVLGEGDELGD